MTRDTQYDRTRRNIITAGGAEAASQVEQEVTRTGRAKAGPPSIGLMPAAPSGV